ncbi:MAG TPA: hypothetical protein VF297_31510 [Pyrinomonadaceae bacterium]
MMKKHTTTRHLLFLLAALCLCATASAQSTKEQAREFRPDASQRAEASRLRGALAAAVGESFEVARDKLTRRSNWHGGQLYWLAHLRAKRPGDYYVKYKYRYKDHANPQDPLYTFVEHQTVVRVGPRGCPRQPRYTFVCVGDTVIFPVVFNDYTEHTFSLVAQPHSPGDAANEKRWRDMEEAGLYREPVHNPAAEFMRYVGRSAHYSPHRAPGFTMTFHATFEAVKPGSFNLSVGGNSVPVVIVAPGQPITILSARDDARGYTERFSSNGPSNNYLTTPVILAVGERLTLEYLTYSRRGRSAGGENETALEATVKDHAPAITLLPFHVDPARDFNEWLVDSLPPSRRE